MRRITISSHSRYPVEKKRIRSVVTDFLISHGIKDDYQVHLMIVGDRKMEQLNKKYLKKTGTTSVLSFPLFNSATEFDSRKSRWPGEIDSDSLDLGEIVISYPQAKIRAIKYNQTLDGQIQELVIHGLKHLLGQHHV